MTEKQINNFWDKVDKKDDSACWNWKAGKSASGYGKVRVNKKDWRSHRLSYWLKHGEFDQSLLVCHSCDNRSCVNPKHLFLGTPKDNIDDMVSKGRHFSPKGKFHPQAKFSDDEIKNIRYDKLISKLTHQEIAHKYNISRSYIYAITNKEKRKEV